MQNQHELRLLEKCEKLERELVLKNRELEIEAALERIRSRSMAMHKSDELMEVIQLVYEQLVRLGLKIDSANFCLNYKESDDFAFWTAIAGSPYPTEFYMPYFDHPWFIRFKEAKTKGLQFTADSYSFEEKNTIYSHFFNHAPAVTEERKKYILSCPGLTMSQVYMNTISLLITNYEGIPFSDEENAVFMRIGNVFEQAYTRFLDLQKAEAQAREAQIEAALERVRSRSLAMHRSDELEQVAARLFEAIVGLGIAMDGALLFVFDREKRNITLWVTIVQLTKPVLIELPYEEEMKDNEIILDYWKATDQGLALSKVYTGEAKNEYFRYVQRHNSSKISEQTKNYLIDLPAWHLSFAAEKNTMLGLDSWSGHLFTESDLNMLRKFVKAFEQAYVRFLDLQKAEAQIRESQIQLSLERIRAKAMAMQHSDELSEFLTVVFEQFDVLNLNPVNCHLSFFDLDNNRSIFRLTGKNGATLIATQEIDLDASPLWKQKIEDWKLGNPSDVDVLFTPYDRLPEIAEIFQEIISKIPDDDRPLPEDWPDGQYVVEGNCKYGYLGYAGSRPPSEEEKEITRRIANEFGNVYQRFLDLQKAEAQAREAQIEAALEKVRSRSLAMHSSDQVREIVKVVFEKLKELQFAIDGGVFVGTMSNNSDHINYWIGDDHAEYPNSFKFPYYDAPTITDAWDAKKSGVEFVSKTYSFQEKNIWFEYAFYHTDLKNALPEDFKKWILEQEYLTQSFAMQKNSMIGVHFHHAKTLTENEIDVLKRFSRVFEQSYVRFLDLQKAEAQAREAQIEAALERVRSRTMAMRGSDELLDIATILFQQVKALGVPQWNCGFNIWEIGDKEFIFYPGSPDGIISPSPCKIPLTEHPVFQRFDESRRRGDDLLIYEKQGEEQEGHQQYMLSLPGVGDLLQSMLDAGFEFPNFQIDHVANFAYGNLIFITYEHFPEMHNVFKRFAKVFEQTYTRFLDLQKAEAQAREAQVEAALERVRSRTMGMQRSDELAEVATLLFQQVKALGVPQWTCGFCIFEIDDKDFTWYPGGPNDEILPPCKIPLTEHPVFVSFNESRKRGDELFVYEKEGEFQAGHYRYMLSLPIVGDWLQSQLDAGISFPDFQIDHVANFAYGNLTFITFEHFPEMHNVFKRFAKVFEQTYTRFLDLQKAEAQAREAQIEAALERVRSRTMGMQRSEELQDAALLLFQQIEGLGLPPFACGFNIWDEDRKAATAWMGSVGGLQPPFKTDSSRDVYLSIYEAAQRRESLFVIEQSGKELEIHYDYLATIPTFRDIILAGWKRDGISVPTFQIIHCAYFTQGYLMFISFEPVPAYYDIFKRFAKVFEQTFTRFLDLQKAEAQAREAQIENALEKVRSRTMAMQHSDELIDVAGLLFDQVSALGIKTWSTGFNVWSEDNNSYVDYLSLNGEIYGPNTVHTEKAEALKELSNARKSGVEFDILYVEGEKIKQLYLAISGIDEKEYDIMVKDGLLPSQQYEHFVFGAKVSVMFITYEPVPEAHDIFKRLGKVFEQTYTRFLDLQKAEAQAQEAIKRASVDRVRAEIASMRTKGDLERIQPLIWNELKILRVPFIRCGVFIMDEVKQDVQVFLSTPDGKSIAAFRLPYYATEQSKQIVTHWQKKHLYKDYMDEAAFTAYTKNLVQQGAMAGNEKYVTENRPTDLYLHFLPFLQGMLYVGNDAPLKEDELQLVQNLADAFSTAYARYEDFNKLELAKAEVESAMTELKATQSQLVQQEKLASLGQLTAGIAHEIKNPLNFVNNFSEVSIEMIGEIKEERAKSQETRDETLVDEILEDIQSNLGKIHEHGTRANGIVTSMLQHSRGGSGKKEPTDLNALIKEYVNLSFHGMRAGKNPINVDIVLDLDPEIKEVSLIKEDFTRVIINLCNNAFDALKSVKTQRAASLNVRTKKHLDTITIEIEDNGPGIPDDIKDKILQPFFTTKKGTEGTGLGLSITHDIVKAHGGELTLDSNEEVGTQFTIKIPIA